MVDIQENYKFDVGVKGLICLPRLTFVFLCFEHDSSAKFYQKKSSYSWKALDQQGIWKNIAIWNRMMWMPNWCFLFGIFCRWSSSPKGKQKAIISVVFIKSCVNVGTPFVWQNKKWQLFSKVQIKKRHNFIFLLVFGRWHKTVCVW